MTTLVWLRGTSLIIDACRLLLAAGVRTTLYRKNPRACSRVTGSQLTVIIVPLGERLAVNVTATEGPGRE